MTSYPNSLVYVKYFLGCIVFISNGSLKLIWFILAHVICTVVTRVCPHWRNKIKLIDNRKACFPLQRKNSGPKVPPWGTPDTTLTSLPRHPSTTTYCDRLERNCVRTDSTEPPTPTEQSSKRISCWLKLKSGTEIDLNYSSLMHHLQSTL